MKALKKTAFVILSTIFIIVVFSLFLPKNKIISRTVVIQAPVDSIFNKVNCLKNWRKWSYWHTLDTNIIIKYVENACGEGAFFEWESTNPKVGAGKIIIESTNNNSMVKTIMNFNDNGTSTGTFYFNQKDSQVHLTWSIQIDLGNNPLNRFMALQLNYLFGKDMEKALLMLKAECEKDNYSQN